MQNINPLPIYRQYIVHGREGVRLVSESCLFCSVLYVYPGRGEAASYS